MHVLYIIWHLTFMYPFERTKSMLALAILEPTIIGPSYDL